MKEYFKKIQKNVKIEISPWYLFTIVTFFALWINCFVILFTFGFQVWKRNFKVLDFSLFCSFSILFSCLSFAVYNFCSMIALGFCSSIFHSMIKLLKRPIIMIFIMHINFQIYLSLCLILSGFCLKIIFKKKLLLFLSFIFIYFTSIVFFSNSFSNKDIIIQRNILLTCYTNMRSNDSDLDIDEICFSIFDQLSKRYKFPLHLLRPCTLR